MNTKDKEKIIKAGKIASQVIAHSKTFIKKGMPLLEIAEKIESEIVKLGGKPAFPTNLSINEIAAHYSPAHDDTTLANGLLKVDLGVQIEGFVADTAFSIDLENSSENKNLIKAAEEALKSAIKLIESKKSKTTLGNIGKEIESTMENNKCIPISNLSGHSIEQNDLHSGLTIPNINTNSDIEIETGLIAIEPFSTLKSASGKIHDGAHSTIYQVISDKPLRNPTSREVLKFIIENYSTLPFCERWLYKKFQNRTNLALRDLVSNGNIHNYTQLVESTKSKVAQAEHTLLIEKDKVIVTTE